jgi:purine-binding chemotaxis protein CheW
MEDATIERGEAERLAGKYMTFRLARQDFGVKILAVRELIRLLEITRVPGAPEFVRGVLNLRGKVIPVADLRRKFGMGETPLGEQTVVIVVQTGASPTGRGGTMGVLVDEVLEVVDIAADKLEPPPEIAGEIVATEHVLAVAKVANRLVFLLDIENALSHAAAKTAEAADAATEIQAHA